MATCLIAKWNGRQLADQLNELGNSIEGSGLADMIRRLEKTFQLRNDAVRGY